MATVDAEKKLQKRVLHWLVNDLGYTYLGNLEDIDNTPVKEDLLKANLKKRGYSDDQIKTAISELLSKVNNQVDTLYQINRRQAFTAIVRALKASQALGRAALTGRGGTPARLC